MDNIAYLQTRERRYRTLGPRAICRFCSETRLFALHRQGTKWICTKHLNRLFGRAEVERHHISGIGRGPKWPTEVNDHNALTWKMERMLAPRFLAPTRSPDEEMFATAVGHVFLSDVLQGKPGSPYSSIDVPPGATSITVNVADFPHFVHVFGTDEAYWRPNWYSAFIRLR